VTRPTVAMVMAAGLGSRMRPLTNDRPKALVRVAGRTLIDHVLDRLVAAGIGKVVVNVHAFADALEAHLAGRRDLEIAIADERAALLETGGGLKAARHLVGDEPIVVANVDSLWVEDGPPALERLIAAWDPSRMDDLLLLAPTTRCLGFHDPGDFFLGDDGALRHRGSAATAPYAHAGVHVVDPRLADAWPEGKYRIFPHWMAMQAKGRLHGVAMAGLWMHVGDPAARDAAEAHLATPA
jgi:MurNAc alpha-1-phosphate uridylyltransferase